MSSKTPYWIPYADDINRNVTMWLNKDKTAMKAVSLDKFFKPHLRSFEKDPLSEEYSIVSQIMGICRTTPKRGFRQQEAKVIKVTSAEGNTGKYNIDILDEIDYDPESSKLYLGQEDGHLLIVNPNGTCFLIAEVVADIFLEA